MTPSRGSPPSSQSAPITPSMSPSSSVVCALLCSYLGLGFTSSLRQPPTGQGPLLAGLGSLRPKGIHPWWAGSTGFLATWLLVWTGDDYNNNS